MKVLKFISKAEALRIADANPGAIKYPYCTGKYKPYRDWETDRKSVV